MLVSLIKGNRINRLVLPNKVVGNYWVTDTTDNTDNKLISIEAMNGKWCLISNEDISVIENNEEKKYIYLQEYSFYLLKIKETNTYLLLYCSPVYDYTYRKYSINSNQEITIGNSANNYIYYNNSGVDDIHAKIVYSSGKFSLLDNNSRLGVYVNNKRIHKTKLLVNGDVIFIAGLKIIVSNENNIPTLLVNNPDNLVKCRLNEIKMENLHKNVLTFDTSNDPDDILDKKLYKKTDYIYKKYRNKGVVKKIDIELEQPPKDNENDDLSFALIIGPMITIFLVGIVLGGISITNGIKSGAFKQEMPSLVVSIIMLCSVFIWPLIIKYYNQKRREKREDTYIDYIEAKKQDIASSLEEQKQVLINNSYTIAECEQIILNKKSNLWERKRNDEDFLTINLGLGVLPADISIKYPHNKYCIDEELYKMVKDLKDSNLTLSNTPLTISLKDKKVISLIGNKKLNRHYIEQILLQLITFHSYDDVKIVLLTDEDKVDKWSYLKVLPHCWSNDRKVRFFASNIDEVKDICYYLKTVDKESTNYIVITDSILKINKIRFINELIKDNSYTNINLLILDEYLANIPKECNNFIRVSDKEAVYYENNLNGINFKFNIDFSTRININECCKRLANIPIVSSNTLLPNQYSLLQMYEVGKVEQLNVYNRWRNNKGTNILNTSVGIDIYGDLININLGDKYQSSHSLVIGLPGSGKTQFIITYIISMCINYHPKDVQFVILENNNELNNIFNSDDKLPHLTGIFSYNVSDLKRFMVSLKNELARRRNLFISAEKEFNKSNIDIYKYQELYNNRQVDISLSHLFIVIDEYDKLEEVQPKFIEKLLKISHIGPSLGVHFIFTVDKQNISNNEYMDIFGSKVLMYDLENTSDNIINHPGRFYLKENSNELLLGKCANGNNMYKPTNKFRNYLDTSIEFINNTGNTIKRVDKINNNSINNGTEITNIVKYLSVVAHDENIIVNQLCLDKLSNYVTVATLMKNYNVNPRKDNIEPIIGEYEDLTNHLHNVLRIQLSNSNNIIHSINTNEYERVISSMLFSSMYLYTPEEVNYYVIDMENSLSDFIKCPLVGDIISYDEDDIIDSLFKVVASKIEERKKLSNEDNLPIIVIVINNFNKFTNMYSKYINNVKNLLSNDYGIRFVLGINEKLPEDISMYFNGYYALRQNNNKDYNQIFNTDIVNYPDDVVGRGLTNIKDNICEFQTASVVPKNKDYHEFIQSQCEECCKEYNNEIKVIPTMPDRITFKQVKHELGKSKEMVIGYNSQLGIIKYDFQRFTMNIVSGEEITNISKFVHPLIKQFAYLNKNDVIVFDALNMNGISNINNLKYVNTDFDENLELLVSFIMDAYSKYYHNERIINRPISIFIYGINELFNKLSDENKERFIKLIKKSDKLDIVNFIIIDNVEELNKIKSEVWYQEMVDNTNGIWVGKGIDKQEILMYNDSIDSNINDNYCYVIQSKLPTITQYVESFDILDN